MKNYGKFADFARLRDFLTAALRQHLYNAAGCSEEEKRYRFEHCLRVAQIGRRVAEKENLDPQTLELGCLLHDIGKWDAKVPVDHGRSGALTAAKLFAQADLPADLCEELAQGIAMHVDGRYNPRTDCAENEENTAGEKYRFFPKPPTACAVLIGECDDIDRFGTYRICDTLRYWNFLSLSTAKQILQIDSYLARLEQMRGKTRHSETTRQLWKENIDYQIGFFSRLRGEIG